MADGWLSHPGSIGTNGQYGHHGQDIAGSRGRCHLGSIGTNRQYGHHGQDIL